ncbi:MAG: Glu/Leu/Phe/Val family dehydrogenase [Candidatus Brocadiia bacterium]
MKATDLDKLSEFINVPREAAELLAYPEKQVKLNLNFRLEDGSLTRTDAFIAYYNTARGPAKGGIRIDQGVTLQETTNLAELMAWKTALMGVPFGGGKAGIKLDPRRFNKPQKGIVLREFVHLNKADLLSGHYIPAPDMGSSEHEMAIIFGETHMFESVTGKPPRIGGLPGRREATGRGLATCVLAAAENILEIKSCDFSVALQGFGNVGSWTAKFLRDAGVRIVAVSDIDGGLFRKDGLDIEDLLKWNRDGKKLVDYPDAEQIPRDDVLSLDVDILIPAATGNVFTREVAQDVNARMIVEGANNPTPPAGDDVFKELGIPIVPDILANSGGVIASYVEWRKAKSGSLTPREEVYDILDDLISKGLTRVLQAANQWKTTYRQAALALAIDEVIKAMEDRGWF